MELPRKVEHTRQTIGEVANVKIREVCAVGSHSAPITVELCLDLLLSDGIPQIENLIDAICPNRAACYRCGIRHTYQVHVLNKIVV